ncbi:MAG: hypothetical protein PHN33_00895 [Candidatus Peribacteraceae bacterium]|nr:hypothetical protein [Candidatus Peribacteraceae bacterium]
MIRRILISLALFSCFAALWIFFNWPALHTEWWAMDDYVSFNQIASQHVTNVFRTLLRGGRPFATLIWILKKVIWMVMQSSEGANIAMRLFQGGTHIIIATIIGVTLARSTGHRLAFWTALPFLLWPFGGEATYWLSAAPYPVASLLSLIGVLLCLQPKATLLRHSFGVGLIICSVLTNQSATLLGLVVFCILLTRSIGGQQWRKIPRKPLGLILLAYTVGGMVSTLCAIWGQDQRITEAHFFLLSTPWNLLLLLWRLLITHSDLYPSWLQFIQIAVIFLPILMLMSHARTRPCSVMRVLFLLLFLAFLPILPNIILDLHWLPGRLLYSAPLIYTAALCLLLLSQRKPFFNPSVVTLLLVALMMGGYYPISRRFALDHVINSRNDFLTIQELDSLAMREDISQIVVAHKAPMINPYKIRYYWFGESVTSAFERSWSTEGLVHFYSTQLGITNDQKANATCLSLCTIHGNSQRHIELISSPFRFICFCP